jgi:3-phosphoshikimate 1-carboxyvinyltransferase
MDGAPDPQDPAAGDWHAPAATRPVHARLLLPGSKSMTNRALVLAAVGSGPTRITGPLRARDTLLMAAALRALGSVIEDDTSEATPAWLVRPGLRGRPAAPGTGAPAAAGPDGARAGTAGADPADTARAAGAGPADTAEVDVGNAGTVIRFVPPVAALTGADVAFRGDVRAARRPVGQLLTALRELGARIDDGGRGAVPFIVRGHGAVAGGTVTLDASGSSQLVSGLLLAAPRYDKGAEIRHAGGRVPSAPHIRMTVAMLRAAGAELESGSRPRGGTGRDQSVSDVWRVHPGTLAPGTISVEPDLSNAAPFLAAALVTSGTVTVTGWPPSSLQPAELVLDLLARMGADCSVGGGELHVRGTGEIRGITADLGDIGELTPVLAALAALATSRSVFTGIGHVRTHESDRLAALAGEIGALGGEVIERSDGLEIRPRPLRADRTAFASHDDHRLVMAAALLGLAVPGLRVRGAATVGKTFPGFARLWAQMLEQSP